MTIDDIKTDLEGAAPPRGPGSCPVVVTSAQPTGFSGFTWLAPIVGQVGTAGLVLTMVIFMLLERRDLCDRLIGLFGHGHLAITTRALTRRQPASAGSCCCSPSSIWCTERPSGSGLYFLGVQYSLVWAALGAALRFVPYIGPVLAPVRPSW